jgi:hypothetical protein
VLCKKGRREMLKKRRHVSKVKEKLLILKNNLNINYIIYLI